MPSDLASYYLVYKKKSYHLGCSKKLVGHTNDSLFPRFIRHSSQDLTTKLLNIIKETKIKQTNKLETIVDILEDEIKLLDSKKNPDSKLVLDGYECNNIDINEILINGINTIFLFFIHIGALIVSESNGKKNYLLASKDPKDEEVLIGRRNTLKHFGIEIIN